MSEDGGDDSSLPTDCPTDEQCSPLTPQGLVFAGPELLTSEFTLEPRLTAVGGTQRIQLYRRDGDGALIPFTVGFDASTRELSHSVTEVGPGWVSLGAHSAAADMLRVTEAGTGLLYGRHIVYAEALGRIEMIPVPVEAWTGEPYGFYSGNFSGVGVGFRLWSIDGNRVVDDSLRLTSASPASMIARQWDTFSFQGLTEGVHAMTATSAGNELSFDVQVFSTIDAVEQVNETVSDLGVGEQGHLCVKGLAASMTGSATLRILDLIWGFSAEGPVTIDGGGGTSNCATLTVNGPGPFSVTASAAGASTTVSFPGAP